MKNLLLVFACTAMLANSTYVFAQDKNPNIYSDLGADLVSAYIWRGIPFDNSPNIQGWGFWGYKNFMIGGWGSVSFNGEYFEPNLWMSYTLKNLNLTITDVDAGFGNDFFNYNPDETSHILDASLSLTLSEKFPLKVLTSVIFYGFDKKVEGYDNTTGAPVLGDGNNYSGYIEMSYPFNIQKTKLEFTAGVTTHKSIVYDTDGFGVMQIAAKASKELQITEKFILPISFAFIANPDANNVYTILQLSF